MGKMWVDARGSSPHLHENGRVQLEWKKDFLRKNKWERIFEEE
jgi:hypothetical protein